MVFRLTVVAQVKQAGRRQHTGQDNNAALKRLSSMTFIKVYIHQDVSPGCLIMDRHQMQHYYVGEKAASALLGQSGLSLVYTMMGKVRW